MRLYYYFYWLAVGLLATAPFAGAQQPTVEQVRQAFYQCTLNSASSDSLLQQLATIEQPTPLIKAYIGATEAIKTQTKWNPYSKYACLKRSRKALNEAVSLDTSNVEIRFLRFSIQHHIPPWLGFSKQMEVDKAVILNNLLRYEAGTLNEKIRQYILTFLKVNEVYPAQQLTQITHRLFPEGQE